MHILPRPDLVSERRPRGRFSTPNLTFGEGVDGATLCLCVCKNMSTSPFQRTHSAHERLNLRTASMRKRDRPPAAAALWRRICERYDSALESRPLLVQVSSVLLLAAVSDVTAQLLEGAALGELDAPRVGRFSSFRAFVATPMYAFWPRALDSRASALGLSGGGAVAAKVACDQLLYLPFYHSEFFLCMNVFEGQQLAGGCGASGACCQKHCL